MESDIIAEGFSLSEQLYGLHYMFVLGDGDSSVMATIRQSVFYGVYVNKIECANHACKAYRSRLKAFAKDNPQFRGKEGLTKKPIQRFTIGARMVIKMHCSTHNSNHLRLTSSNFVKVVKQHDTTLVANLVKTLVYRKVFSMAATQWALTHEEDARAAYIQYLHQDDHYVFLRPGNRLG